MSEKISNFLSHIISLFFEEFTLSDEIDLTNVEEDNRLFIRTLATFSSPFLSFIKKIKDLELLLTYFVNILCHSVFEEEVLEFVQSLNQLILIQKQTKYVLNFVSNRFENFVDCIVGPIPKSFSQAVVELITFSIKRCDVVTSFRIANQFLKQIPKLEHDCLGQIPRFFYVFVEFLSISDVAIIYAVQQGWLKRMMSIIERIFDGHQKEQYYKCSDFQVFFEALSTVLSSVESASCDCLLPITNSIAMSSAHIQRFTQLVCVAATNHGLDLMQFIDIIVGSKDFSSEVLFQVMSQIVLCSPMSECAEILFRRAQDRLNRVRSWMI
jgi:hypothetical protein